MLNYDKITFREKLDKSVMGDTERVIELSARLIDICANHGGVLHYGRDANDRERRSTFGDSQLTLMESNYIASCASVRNLVSLPEGERRTSIMCLSGSMPDGLVEAFTELYGADNIIQNEVYTGKFPSEASH